MPPAAATEDTLNDANVTDTITPATRPCEISVTFDLTNLLNAGDDFDLEISVGAGGSERVVEFYNVTSDGADLFIDNGSGVAALTELRKIDAGGIQAALGEVVKLDYTKNSANSRDIDYQVLERI